MRSRLILGGLFLLLLGLLAAGPVAAHPRLAPAGRAAGAMLTPAPGDAVPTGEQQSSPPPPPWRWLWRALALVSTAGLFGGPLFSSLVLGGAPADEVRALAAPLGRRLARLTIGLSILLLLALGADMLYQIAALINVDALGAAGRLDLAGPVITTTAYGGYWALRVLEGGALLVYGLWRRRSPARLDWTAAVLGAGVLLAGEALASHAAAAPPVAGLPLGLVGDLVHLLAAGAWIGGLIYLAVVLLPVLRRQDPAPAARVLGQLVPRFSTLALASAGVLAVTGVLNLALHTLDPAAIVDSDYGRLLIVKHLLFLPLLGLGAINNRLVYPRLATALGPGRGPVAGGVVPRVGRAIGAEVVLGGAVLLCAAGLTLLPPPVSLTAAAGAPLPPIPSTPGALASPVPVVATLRQVVGGVAFALEVRPAPEGDQFRLDLTRVDSTTVPLSDVLKVQLRVIPQDVDAGTTSLDVVLVGPAGPDHQVYTATGQVLTLSGAYQLNAEFLRQQADDLRAGFRLVLADDGGLSIARSDILRALLTTRPSPPLTGTAEVDIHLLDGQDHPVTGVEVKVTPLMPAHGHVEPQGAALPVAGSPGVYRMPVRFTMGGPWLLIVEADRPGQPPVKTDATLDVVDPYATPTPPPPR